MGIEGHYPLAGDPFLLSSWAEYAELLESKAYYALDMSHLNIVARQSKQIEKGLVAELLNCDRCLEIHVSGNNGERDSHRKLIGRPWWWSLMEKHAYPEAVIFSESNQHPSR